MRLPLCFLLYPLLCICLAATLACEVSVSESEMAELRNLVEDLEDLEVTIKVEAESATSTTSGPLNALPISKRQDTGEPQQPASPPTSAAGREPPVSRSESSAVPVQPPPMGPSEAGGRPDRPLIISAKNLEAEHSENKFRFQRDYVWAWLRVGGTVERIDQEGITLRELGSAVSERFRIRDPDELEWVMYDTSVGGRYGMVCRLRPSSVQADFYVLDECKRKYERPNQ